MFDSILVVCTGNICRSPIGERLLRRALPNKKIDSAGVGALVNHAADASAIRTAAKHGLSLEGHKGRQFTSSLGGQYDLVLVMEHSHLEQVSELRQKCEAKQCCLAIGWGEKRSRTHIAKVMRLLIRYIS